MAVSNVLTVYHGVSTETLIESIGSIQSLGSRRVYHSLETPSFLRSQTDIGDQPVLDVCYGIVGNTNDPRKVSWPID